MPLPRDEDIDILEAISMIGGPLLNGGVNGNNLSGGIVGAGLGNPSPNLLTVIRRTPNGQQVPIRVDLERAMVDARERILVQEGDMLLLQETPSQAVARYFSQIFQFNAIGEVFKPWRRERHSQRSGPVNPARRAGTEAAKSVASSNDVAMRFGDSLNADGTSRTAGQELKRQRTSHVRTARPCDSVIQPNAAGRPRTGEKRRMTVERGHAT